MDGTPYTPSWRTTTRWSPVYGTSVTRDRSSPSGWTIRTSSAARGTRCPRGPRRGCPPDAQRPPPRGPARPGPGPAAARSTTPAAARPRRPIPPRGDRPRGRCPSRWCPAGGCPARPATPGAAPGRRRARGCPQLGRGGQAEAGVVGRRDHRVARRAGLAEGVRNLPLHQPRAAWRRSRATTPGRRARAGTGPAPGALRGWPAGFGLEGEGGRVLPQPELLGRASRSCITSSGTSAASAAAGRFHTSAPTAGVLASASTRPSSVRASPSQSVEITSSAPSPSTSKSHTGSASVAYPLAVVWRTCGAPSPTYTSSVTSSSNPQASFSGRCWRWTTRV